MRVAVSDSNSFVGKRVCRLLEENNIELVRIDDDDKFNISDKNSYRTIPPVDHFIHLSCMVYVPLSYEDPYTFYHYNYMSTLNALEFCRLNKVHFIYASSYIYGTPEYLPVDENHKISPFNPYAETKALCEKLCEGYSKYLGVKSTILRLFNIYGENQTGNLLIPQILSQINDKGTIMLRSSTPRRDYVYVEDVARAFIASLNEQSDYTIYNVCSGKSVSIKELTILIRKAYSELGKEVNFVFSEEDRNNEVDETVGTYQKIESALGWHPSVTLEEGIIRMLKNDLRIEKN